MAKPCLDYNTEPSAPMLVKQYQSSSDDTGNTSHRSVSFYFQSCGLIPVSMSSCFNSFSFPVSTSCWRFFHIYKDCSYSGCRSCATWGYLAHEKASKLQCACKNVFSAACLTKGVGGNDSHGSFSLLFSNDSQMSEIYFCRVIIKLCLHSKRGRIQPEQCAARTESGWYDNPKLCMLLICIFIWSAFEGNHKVYIVN